MKKLKLILASTLFMFSVLLMFVPQHQSSAYSVEEKPEPNGCLGCCGEIISYHTKCVLFGVGCIATECPDGTTPKEDDFSIQ
jgi:hypothetical protein